MTALQHETQKAAPREEPGDSGFRDGMIELIPFLRAFARTLCQHRDGADDLCQEALTRAWQARASFTPGTNLKAWLFMILRNQFYSERRRAWRQKPWDEGMAEQRLTTHASQDSAIAFSDVVHAMRQLPNEQREALILVGAGGFAYEETAEICGCAVGTIKSRVARARQALAKVRDGEAPPLEGTPPPSGEALSQISTQLDVLVQAKAAVRNKTKARPRQRPKPAI
jgi:RNA polymerase sigma-70 factor (ECF subfamily)